MNKGQKHYVKILGLNVLKFKFKAVDRFNVYLFSIPLLTISFCNKKTRVNLYIIQKIYEKINRTLKKYKEQKKIKNSKLKIIKKFKNGEKIKICLQASRPGTWSYSYLYKLLNADSRFEVFAFINPDPYYGVSAQNSYLSEVADELEQSHIDYILGYDKNTKKFYNLKKEINPDLILYSDFINIHFYPQYYINNFLDKITMLCEYGFSNMLPEETMFFPLKNMVDIFFRPTIIHKDMSQKYMKNNGKNVVVVGSPKLDVRFDNKFIIKDVWKPQTFPKKRIIWAPHHGAYTDKKLYRVDAFWEIYDFMLDLAHKYKDRIQIAFRPHPILKAIAIKKWGVDKTEDYYNKWQNLENTQISEGAFLDLFETSDAMIMDCCSFLSEYTAFNKPLFYTSTQTSVLKLNDFGESVFKNVYTTSENLKQDIEHFIEDVVLRGNDYKKAERTEFVKKYFGKINGKTASENIYNEIIKFLEKGKIA